MDFTKLHWTGDFMYSEIIGESYEIENDFVVGMYTLADFPEINVHINTETGEIIDVWLMDEK